jgi:hypothetical protein
MNNVFQEVNDMSDQDEINNRIKALELEVARGWIIYGRFMDANNTAHPDAAEVRETIRKLTIEKSKLLMMVNPDEAKDFIEKHKQL